MRLTILILGFAIFSSLAAVTTAAEALGDKVVEFCKKHEGEKVGSGECASLASNALRSAGAQDGKRGDDRSSDYTWGKLIATFDGGEKNVSVTGKARNIEAGDILQFRDAKFSGKRSRKRYSYSAGHHTAVVFEVKDEGRLLEIYHQNVGGTQYVRKATLDMDNLKEGWVKVYEPERRKSERKKPDKHKSDKSDKEKSDGKKSKK